MNSAIDGLKPELVWKYFAEIARIPRCSKHEKAMSEYVIDTAKRPGPQAREGKMGQVVLRISPHPGN